eukprot:scaffold12688_cov49-Attheya_sp.AAC.3
MHMVGRTLHIVKIHHSRFVEAGLDPNKKLGADRTQCKAPRCPSGNAVAGALAVCPEAKSMPHQTMTVGSRLL